LIGEEGMGFRYILSGMNAERILIGAECIGDAKWFIEKATAYAKERVLFERPIGQNQGVQFPIARAYAQMRAAELMVHEAAELYQPDPVLSRRARARPAALLLAHVPAKWPPVRRKGHAPTHEIRARPDSAGTGRALMSLPLSGLLVVSIEQAVAAPMCSCR